MEAVELALPLVVSPPLGIRFGLGQANQFQEQRLKNDLELIGRAISLPVGTALNNRDMEAVELALPLVLLTALGIRYGLGQANQFQEQRLKNDLELIGRAR